MADYTTPITATFELQRQALVQSQRAIETGFEFQKEMATAAVESLDVQEASQRQVVEFLQDNVHRTLDAMEELPGTAGMTEEVRTTVDDQYAQLLDAHAEAFDTIEDEFDDGTESYNEMMAEYLDTLDEQLETLLDAHEEVESHSVEATEQVEELQDQVEDVQAQIQDVSEQAADAIEA
ncbi:hypothetical protein SAMN05216226_105213 [Halovenus aranensis]|uniref:Uncharacterized protein n=1 Tax=Halovenus aranensis TaxID=890420 RepID=A0A1G8V1X3_9EURY|nr:hypothetical protein [Halovenus aranensis]SDJ59170.1 hypothetical protein SAMN05216226_105213 [Halovenus aranensis]